MHENITASIINQQGSVHAVRARTEAENAEVCISVVGGGGLVALVEEGVPYTLPQPVWEGREFLG